MPVEIAGRTYDGFECEALMKERVPALDFEHEGETMPQEARAEWNKLNAAIDEFGKRRERIREIGSRPGNTMPAVPEHPARTTDDVALPARLREDEIGAWAKQIPEGHRHDALVALRQRTTSGGCSMRSTRGQTRRRKLCDEDRHHPRARPLPSPRAGGLRL